MEPQEDNPSSPDWASDLKFDNTARKRNRLGMSTANLGGESDSDEDDMDGEDMSDSEEQPDVLKYLGRWDIPKPDQIKILNTSAAALRATLNATNPAMKGKRF